MGQKSAQKCHVYFEWPQNKKGLTYKSCCKYKRENYRLSKKRKTKKCSNLKNNKYFKNLVFIFYKKKLDQSKQDSSELKLFA